MQKQKKPMYNMNKVVKKSHPIKDGSILIENKNLRSDNNEIKRKGLSII